MVGLEFCKKCIHEDLCEKRSHLTNSDGCCQFKDKDLFVEIPCKVGDRLWYIDKNLVTGKNEIKETYCTRIAILHGDIVFSLFVNIREIDYSIEISKRDFDETIFVKNEKAKQKLQQLQEVEE